MLLCSLELNGHVTERGRGPNDVCRDCDGLGCKCKQQCTPAPNLEGLPSTLFPAARAQIEFQSGQAMAEVERETHKEDCTSLAIKEASKSAGWALATSGILVSVANGLSPAFQRALGVSGKAALVVSSTLTACPRRSRGCQMLHDEPAAPRKLRRGPDPNWSPALLRQRDHRGPCERKHSIIRRARPCHVSPEAPPPCPQHVSIPAIARPERSRPPRTAPRMVDAARSSACHRLPARKA